LPAYAKSDKTAHDEINHLRRLPSAETGNYHCRAFGFLGGDDTVDAAALTAGFISLTADGGIDDDVLTGSSGADVLLGGAGDDVLIGGPGVDVLDGGTGSNMLIQD
jgi:Ca2+-binding RTX toxin-like protein